jgi:nicotinamidase-related amidase
MEFQPSRVALLLIDTINDFAFEGSEGLVEAAQAAAPRIHALAERARRVNVPVIYVNDNFGRWRSNFHDIVSICTRDDAPGHDVSSLLHPTDADYFVLKPRHSGFYRTALETLLEKLQVRTLVLVGFATNICVLFTANDARMRGYRVVIPSDCAASNTPELTAAALAHCATVLEADTRPSSEVDFDALAATAGPSPEVARSSD